VIGDHFNHESAFAEATGRQMNTNEHEFCELAAS